MVRHCGTFALCLGLLPCLLPQLAAPKQQPAAPCCPAAPAAPVPALTALSATLPSTAAVAVAADGDGGAEGGDGFFPWTPRFLDSDDEEDDTRIAVR